MIDARMHSAAEASRFVEVFLATPFSGDARHAHRISLLTAYDTAR